MQRDELVDLAAFLAVAEDPSFNRAVARLSTSQSALSQTVRLKARLGLKLSATIIAPACRRDVVIAGNGSGAELLFRHPGRSVD